MKDDAFEMCLLFDFYGAILTERQQEVFDLYYNDDLSLAEISEHAEITRQGVRDAISRSKNILAEMEEKLGLVKRFRESAQTINTIHLLAQELDEINCKRFHSADIDKRLSVILKLSEEQQQ